MASRIDHHIDDLGVAFITLARPDKHNAFDETLIDELTETLAACGADPAVRAVVLTGQGKSFSAGADLDWMRRQAENDFETNLDDARALARLMHTLDRLPKPTIALVNGSAYGGGVGLAACCDIVLAADRASFCLSEVKLGLIPAVISPYVVAAIGPRHARRYFVTAEVFSAQRAREIGLVHEVVEASELTSSLDRVIDAILQGGPQAQAEAKGLVFAVDRPLDSAVVDETATRIAQRRASEEGREGVGAFLERREPRWRQTRIR